MEKDPITDRPWNGSCPGCGGSDGGAEARGFRQCRDCGTLWVPSRREFQYDNTYPAFRGHHDDIVADCKIRTFERWLRHLGIELEDRHVLEVGFGGGSTLAWMGRQGAQVCGVEPVEANRSSAVRFGVPEANVKADLADFGGNSFDLVVYQDSFEHETEPASHLQTLNRLTRSGARALLVLPIADCLSRRFMGSWWPHDIVDHWVFYSTDGLKQLWQHHGWRMASTFRPGKYISGLTMAAHFQHKTGIQVPPRMVPGTRLWLNFGECGLIFEKR
jgi:SAM-dependent methyltransferase